MVVLGVAARTCASRRWFLLSQNRDISSAPAGVRRFWLSDWAQTRLTPFSLAAAHSWPSRIHRRPPPGAGASQFLEVSSLAAARSPSSATHPIGIIIPHNAPNVSL
jgi:hypothetical protein